MKKLLVYGISLIILAGVLILSYKYVQGRLNPKEPARPPSRLENCQNLTINAPKLIAFANKCLLEYGKNRSAYASARNISDYTYPRNITDYGPPEIKRFSESEIRRFYNSKNEKLPEIEFPDEWAIFYHKKAHFGGNEYVVTINRVTCECKVDGVP